MMKLTEEQIKQNDDIPTEEIDQYEAGLAVLRGDPVQNRLEIYLRDGKISIRKDFINKLNQILEYRNKVDK
jgi:hypothetical protein